MKYIYDISDTMNLISIELQDLKFYEEIEDLINTIIQDPNYKPAYNFLIDIRRLKYIPIIGEMRKFSDFLISHKKHFKGAAVIITCNEVHHYMLSFSSKILSKKGFRNRIFCNLEKAINWLNDINSDTDLKEQSIHLKK